MLHLVGNPKDRFFQDAAQYFLDLIYHGVRHILFVVIFFSFCQISVCIDVSMCSLVHDMETVIEPLCEKTGLWGF